MTTPAISPVSTPQAPSVGIVSSDLFGGFDDITQTDENCPKCGNALATAIITRPEAIPDQTRRDLAPIIGKYLAAT